MTYNRPPIRPHGRPKLHLFFALLIKAAFFHILCDNFLLKICMQCKDLPKQSLSIWMIFQFVIPELWNFDKLALFQTLQLSVDGCIIPILYKYFLERKKQLLLGLISLQLTDLIMETVSLKMKYMYT